MVNRAKDDTLYVSNKQTFDMLQIKSIIKSTFIINSKKIMQIPRLTVFSQQPEEMSVLESGVSTSVASAEEFCSQSVPQKIQTQTKPLKNKSVGCQPMSDKLEQQVMIWFTLRGIKEGFPEQLLQDMNLLQRREIISHLQRSQCNKSACQLGKRIKNDLHISV